jgi:carbon-monoxide dehydrogenase large subunit
VPPNGAASGITAHARNEDAFLRGAGRYVDDIKVENEAYGVVLRSPHAHARIVRIDTRLARESAGVLAVLTAADLAGIVRPLACVMPLISRDGTPRVEADRVVLAVERVRHVGDGVAFVVAETPEQAVDAAGRIDVTYDVLPAATAPGVSAVPVWDGPGQCVLRLAIRRRRRLPPAVRQRGACRPHLAQ